MAVHYHATVQSPFGRYDKLLLVDETQDSAALRKRFERQSKYAFSRILSQIVAGNSFK